MIYYDKCLAELKDLIPQDEIYKILNQRECEYEFDFFGFVNIYKPLSLLIPKNKIVIDFGCYLAPQAYFFSDHVKYIGVDLVKMERFSPGNAKHFCCSIEDFIKQQTPILFKENDNRQYFAICSYVPDFKSTELVRKTFQNVCCYYP